MKDNEMPDISFDDSLAGLYQHEDRLKRMIYQLEHVHPKTRIKGLQHNNEDTAPLLAKLKEVQTKIAAWGTGSEIYRIM